MGTLLYTNQFQQQVALGDPDLQIQQTGALAGILSPNQSSPATTVNAGAPAVFDTTITTGYVPNFLQAGQNVLAIGFFRRTSMEGVFGLLDQVEVVLTAGAVIWLLASGTITPGATVYSDSTGGFVTVSSGGAKTRGIAIDYATNGNVLRVLITNPLAIATS